MKNILYSKKKIFPPLKIHQNPTLLSCKDYLVLLSIIFIYSIVYFFFWIRENFTLQKEHFMDSGERIKPRLSQAFTRNACPDLNLKLAVQILNSLSSHYTS
jgi:hypothetical protein